MKLFRLLSALLITTIGITSVPSYAFDGESSDVELVAFQEAIAFDQVQNSSSPLLADAGAGSGDHRSLFRKLLKILMELLLTIKAYFAEIDVQIRSSECHNRSCTSYGNG